ncbi:MAG: ABC transporter permease [Dehalococcoidia bacterium]|nr:MAG: ABC transporter permease [Dehalococcoidia bacterium]
MTAAGFPIPAEVVAVPSTNAAVAVVRAVGHFARRKPLGFIGGLLVAGLVFTALFAPLLAPYDPNAIDLRHRLEAPSASHWLGTDGAGHDVLSRLIYGTRISMTVGFGSVLISTIGATAIGLIAAYIGGWVDTAVQQVVSAWIAMPDLIVLITFLGIVRRIPDANLTLALLLALAFLRTAGTSRLVRSVVLEIRARPFVEAAEASGAGTPRMMLAHVLPNIFPILLVSATVALPGTILAEASLSFLGFGPAGTSSWGQMLSVEGREFFTKQWGLAVYPGLCIAGAVFGFNMFGDALRDVLDPRLRGSR